MSSSAATFLNGSPSCSRLFRKYSPKEFILSYLFGLIRQKYNLFLVLLSVRWEKLLTNFSIFIGVRESLRIFEGLALCVGKKPNVPFVGRVFSMCPNVLALRNVGLFGALSCPPVTKVDTKT